MIELYKFGAKGPLCDPSTLDAAAYGILSQMILSDTFNAPIFDHARKYNNLVEYT